MVALNATAPFSLLQFRQAVLPCRCRLQSIVDLRWQDRRFSMKMMSAAGFRNYLTACLNCCFIQLFKNDRIVLSNPSSSEYRQCHPSLLILDVSSMVYTFLPRPT